MSRDILDRIHIHQETISRLNQEIIHHEKKIRNLRRTCTHEWVSGQPATDDINVCKICKNKVN